MKIKIAAVLITVLLYNGCNSNKDSNEEIKYNLIRETQAIELNLGKEFEDPDYEFSGLSWLGDSLIMMPQYALRDSSDGGGFLYFVTKSEIKLFLDHSIKVITPGKIPIVCIGLEEYSGKGSGFEAIVFDGNDVFASIEYSNLFSTSNVIVKGIVNYAEKRIEFINPVKIEFESQTEISNTGDETLLMFNENLVSLHEAYGKNVNNKSFSTLVDKNLDKITFKKFPTIEYRITDATNIDSDNKFWVINYMWNGDKDKLIPAFDSIAGKYGLGESQYSSGNIERLVELQISDNKTIFSDYNPIYLKLERESRNWEGIARLDSSGFIIVTDSYPRTELAFVPLKTRD